MIKIANKPIKTNYHSELDGYTKVFAYDTIVAFKQAKNDVNGNPMYRVYPINFSFRRLDRTIVYRNMENRDNPYYLLQSFDINKDLEKLLFEVYTLIKPPKFNLDLLINYTNVKTHYDYLDPHKYDYLLDE